MKLSFAQQKVIWRLHQDVDRGIGIRGLTSDDMHEVMALTEKELPAPDAHALVGGLLKLAYEFETLTQKEMEFYASQVKQITQKYSSHVTV